MEMNNDIVEQLREEGFITHMARLPRESKILHKAADEIERLRKELDTRIAMCDMRSERIIELEGIIDSSLDDIPSLQASIDSMSDEITMLVKERDEARREVCGLLVACHTDPDDDDKPDPNLKHIHAGIRGWDCYKNYINYKENTNG